MKRKNSNAEIVERDIPFVPKKRKKYIHDRADEARKRAISTKWHVPIPLGVGINHFDMLSLD